jgi:ubiquinol-cytochrome c reductase cytochrome b subunit
MGQRIREWLEVRIGLDEIIRSQLTEYHVPKNINIFYTLGMVAFGAFALQVVTGILLIFYYIPSDKDAVQSIQFIMNQVPYGWLFRLMHVVGSNLMVAVVICHLGSVFFLGAYKKPRELTWVLGAFLLLTTLGFCLSGYLLAWSQLSFWATTVVTTMPQAFPFIGNFISEIMRGGENVSGATLNRFFALHVAFFPLLLVGLFALHAFLVRRIGISAPPGSEEPQEWQVFHHESHPGGPPFFPDFVAKEVFMTCIYLVVMFAIISFVPALFIPADANIPADPLNTPAHIRPEWYFLAPYAMLKLVPNRFLGIALQVVLVLVFIFWPFIDRAKEHNILKRPKLLAFFFVTIIVWIGLTIWGSR